MPKRSNEKNLGVQAHMKAKLTLRDIEENSIDQLIAQPTEAVKETLENWLAANTGEIARLGEEITRLSNLNIKILECLDRIGQQDQEDTGADGITSKVSFNQI
jgi:hypothetical protein